MLVSLSVMVDTCIKEESKQNQSLSLIEDGEYRWHVPINHISPHSPPNIVAVVTYIRV